MRSFLAILIGLSLVVSLGGCPKTTTPAKPSIGHNNNQAGVPDPPVPPPTSTGTRLIRFRVETTINVLPVFNAGFGNRFPDGISPPGDTWTEQAIIGAEIYIGASPAKRKESGLINVYADYGTNNDLICYDSNAVNHKAGASCTGKVHK
jgi:hypothetical protein